MEKKSYKIRVDKQTFEVSDQYITGSELKKLVSAPSSYGVWLKVQGNKDIEIGDSEKVDLAQPGREHFFTGPKQTTEGEYVFTRV